MSPERRDGEGTLSFILDGDDDREDDCRAFIV